MANKVIAANDANYHGDTSPEPTSMSNRLFSKVLSFVSSEAHAVVDEEIAGPVQII
mgnify:CR=1 FL=1